MASRTDPDDDDVVDVTSFSALDVVEIKDIVLAVVSSRTDPDDDDDVVVVGTRRS